MVSPRFLGPKIFIICPPAGPCFLCGMLLSRMGMLFQLWWWMRTVNVRVSYANATKV